MHSVLYLQATTYCACWLSLKLPLILLVMSEGCCAEWGCAAPLYTCAHAAETHSAYMCSLQTLMSGREAYNGWV